MIFDDLRRGVLDWISQHLPEWVQQLPRWLFVPLYWLVLLFVCVLYAFGMPVFSVLLFAGPVVLIWWTSRRGLARVPTPLYVAVVLLLIMPAFFLAQYQDYFGDEFARSQSPITAYYVVGYAGFLIAVTGLARMLKYVNRGHDKIGSEAERLRSRHRLNVFDLTISTMTLTAVTNVGVAFCLLALFYRRKWTAFLAMLACGLAPLLDASPRAELTWLGIALGFLLAFKWVQAARNPYWRPGDHRTGPPTDEYEEYTHIPSPPLEQPTRPNDPPFVARLRAALTDLLPAGGPVVHGAWVFAVSKLLRRTLPGLPEWMAGRLDRYCAIRVSQKAIGLDANKPVLWSNVRAVYATPLLDAISDSVVDRLAGWISNALPVVPGKDRAVRWALQPLYALLWIALGDHAERAASALVPTVVVYKGTFGGARTLVPGLGSAILLGLPQVADCVLSTAAENGVRLYASKSTYDPAAVAARRAAIQGIKRQIEGLLRRDDGLPPPG